MKYILQKYSDDEYDIANDDADSRAGYVRPLQLGSGLYRVENSEGDEIAVVKSIDEAIPALAAYYKKNPPRWERVSETDLLMCCTPHSCTYMIKETQFGPLWVDLIKPGNWLVYRQTNGTDHPLLRDGKPAIFATCEEAQHAADAHFRDGYPNSETINDGFSWLPYPDIDWRACPYRTATRARLAV